VAAPFSTLLNKNRSNARRQHRQLRAAVCLFEQSAVEYKKNNTQRVRSRTSAVCLRIDARNVCGPGEARAVGETQTMRKVKKGAV
jgi:hypothetical protein